LSDVACEVGFSSQLPPCRVEVDFIVAVARDGMTFVMLPPRIQVKVLVELPLTKSSLPNCLVTTLAILPPVLSYFLMDVVIAKNNAKSIRTLKYFREI